MMMGLSIKVWCWIRDQIKNQIDLWYLRCYSIEKNRFKIDGKKDERIDF